MARISIAEARERMARDAAFVCETFARAQFEADLRLPRRIGRALERTQDRASRARITVCDELSSAALQLDRLADAMESVTLELEDVRPAMWDRLAAHARAVARVLAEVSAAGLSPASTPELEEVSAWLGRLRDALHAYGKADDRLRSARRHADDALRAARVAERLEEKAIHLCERAFREEASAQADLLMMKSTFASLADDGTHFREVLAVRVCFQQKLVDNWHQVAELVNIPEVSHSGRIFRSLQRESWPKGRVRG